MRIAFSMLGLSALMVGGLIFLVGPAMTGELVASILRLVVPDTPPLSGLGGPDVDSELRFYAVLWIAYGGTALWVARAITERMRLLGMMLVIFWFGGVGRLVSYFAVGSVPRARLETRAGGSHEWKRRSIEAYQRRRRKIEALIAGAYLSGTNTRRVKRALASLFERADGQKVLLAVQDMGGESEAS